MPDKADGQSHLRDGIQPPFPSVPSPLLSLVPRLTTHFSITIGGLLHQRLAIFRRNTKLPPFVAEKGQRAKETFFSAYSHISAALAARSFSKGPQNRTGDRKQDPVFILVWGLCLYPRTEVWLGDAQWVKCLPYKSEDLSSIWNLDKVSYRSAYNVGTPYSLWEVETGACPEVHRPASLAHCLDQ